MRRGVGGDAGSRDLATNLTVRVRGGVRVDVELAVVKGAHEPAPIAGEGSLEIRWSHGAFDSAAAVAAGPEEGRHHWSVLALGAQLDVDLGDSQEAGGGDRKRKARRSQPEAGRTRRLGVNGGNFFGAREENVYLRSLDRGRRGTGLDDGALPLPRGRPVDLAAVRHCDGRGLWVAPMDNGAREAREVEGADRIPPAVLTGNTGCWNLREVERLAGGVERKPSRAVKPADENLALPVLSEVIDETVRLACPVDVTPSSGHDRRRVGSGGVDDPAAGSIHDRDPRRVDSGTGAGRLEDVDLTFGVNRNPCRGAQSRTQDPRGFARGVLDHQSAV